MPLTSEKSLRHEITKTISEIQSKFCKALMNFSYPKDFPPDLYLTQATTLHWNQPCDLLLLPRNQIRTAHAPQCSMLYATYNNIRGYGKHRTIIPSVFPTWTLLAHKDKDINSFIIGHRLSHHTANAQDNRLPTMLLERSALPRWNL